MDENTTQNQTDLKPALRRPVRAIPQQQEEKKERIKVWMGICMIIVALCVDGIQALLFFLGPTTSIVAYFGFWVWFKILGVSFTTNPKKLLTAGATGLGELFLGFLPVFTAGIAAIVFITWAEDKGGLLGKAVNMTQGKVKS